jgi:uncharacterized protein YfeS
MMDDTTHDPFDEPELAHPRARELLVEEFFWDCADEVAPFGSDEGHDAYFEFRRWRREHPAAPLTACFSWILEGRLDEYSPELHSDSRVAADLADPDGAFLASSYDMFMLDATIIATAFAQLIDEGRIDADAKKYVRVALMRQLHPDVVTGETRRRILQAALRVLDQA